MRDASGERIATGSRRRLSPGLAEPTLGSGADPRPTGQSGSGAERRCGGVGQPRFWRGDMMARPRADDEGRWGQRYHLGHTVRFRRSAADARRVLPADPEGVRHDARPPEGALGRHGSPRGCAHRARRRDHGRAATAADREREPVARARMGAADGEPAPRLGARRGRLRRGERADAPAELRGGRAVRTRARAVPPGPRLCGEAGHRFIVEERAGLAPTSGGCFSTGRRPARRASSCPSSGGR